MQEEDGEKEYKTTSKATSPTRDTRAWNNGLVSKSSSPPPRAVSPKQEYPLYPWRVRDRMRTTNGALVLCLNIGVDPPDVSKPTPCARLECWTEPNVDDPSKSLQHIANSLKAQYEWWLPKARYRVAPDPTVAELKRVCVNLRRAAKEERVLFHYNGHGVPCPTANGEIWFFNHNYTQYIPFNLYDLQEVLGSPSLYILDCNSAGTILSHFQKLSAQLDRDWGESYRKLGREHPPPSHRYSILLGACAEGELLPTTSSIPADLFTSCLTTPIKTALRCFSKRTLVQGFTSDMLDRIPGHHNSRQTPLGDLHWVLTAITDTIAWNVLPRDIFKKLYRQDLLLASLMRNFLLADRLMRLYGCTPVSHPSLPETHNHLLWQSFELSMEQLLAQLPRIIAEEDAKKMAEAHAKDEAVYRPTVRFAHTEDDLSNSTHNYGSDSVKSFSSSNEKFSHSYLDAENSEKEVYRFRPSTFFEDQMKAFDVWLNMGPDQRDPPEQLPIMLQVLLSPALRVKAMPLLSRYLQTGPMAVDLALSVGLFPYMLRLLQSHTLEIRQELVFIWGKILALDESCRTDLVKEKGEEYFVRFLTPGENGEEDPKPVYLAVAMFVISVLAKDFADGCRNVGTLNACFARLVHPSPFVRRWACLCLTEVIRNGSPPAQTEALHWTELIHTLEQCATKDSAPDVRAAAVSTLSCIMNGVLGGLEAGKACSSTTSPFDPMENGSQIGLQFHWPSSHSQQGDGNDRGPPRYSDFQDSSRLVSTDCNLSDFSAVYPERDPNVDNTSILPYMRDEKIALLKIGKVLAEVANLESSVLVRREIAIAIAKAVKCREDRFVRAACLTDLVGMEDGDPYFLSSDEEKCEVVYRKLWISLSELAFDPHPVDAAHARRSYDFISEKLLDYARLECISASDGMRSTDHGISPQQGSGSDDCLNNSPAQLTSTDCAMPSSSSNTPPKPKSVTEWTDMHAVKAFHLIPHHDNLPPQLHRNLEQARARGANGTGSIHVRSTSGSFDLTVSSRLPLHSNIPRVNSANHIGVVKPLSPPKFGFSKLEEKGRNPHKFFDYKPQQANEEAKKESPPRIALAKGMENLVKTFSQQFLLNGSGSSPPSSRYISNNENSKDGKDNRIEKGSKSFSPPRPPRRSLSYTVLNSATSLSPGDKTTLYSRPPKTAYSKRKTSDESAGRKAQGVPSGYTRSYLSGDGDAALSLYEWSSMYIARVQFDATTADYSHEEEGIPRYAALWHKFMKSSSAVPVEDSLRAFARLGEENEVVEVGGPTAVDEDGQEFKDACELSVYSMAAGGGAVTAIAYLPRDSGMGDDQLLATGDSTGSVGVYDIRTGSCQGSFGVPSPPGIPEVGISSVLCLNPPCSEKSETTSVINSRSALILAGAYDGRVAIFKSDVQGRKYRIMSTFQASGQSFWSKVGTRREPSMKLSWQSWYPQRGVADDGMILKSSSLREKHPASYSREILESGNGLVLAFDVGSSYLAAAGCDSDVVRIWDVSREHCIWEGISVEERTWPTCVTLWDRVNPFVFVVGSSNGFVNIVDTREGPAHKKAMANIQTLGRHKHPLISVGTCPRGKYTEGEMVVAADTGGEIAFWDPRWNGRCSSSEKNAEVGRIKAHQSRVAAMAVHPSGRYVASGSAGRCVKIFGPNREMVKMLSHYESSGTKYRTDHIAPVTSLAFQHETSLLAIGCEDSSVMIYGRPKHFSGILT